MIKAIKIIILMILIIYSALAIYSFTVIDKPAPVRYVNGMPGTMLAATIPPLGIFIDKKYIDEGSKPCSILAHERIHWLQYQEMGLFNFYSAYISGWLKHGRLYNRLEADARKRSSTAEGCSKLK